LLFFFGFSILLIVQPITKNANGTNNLQGRNLKIRLLPIAVAVLILLSLQCSSTNSLSDTEKAKLDPPLLHLLSGDREDNKRLDITLRADGIREYAVIVRSEHPEDIRALGINVSSGFRDVIVVHVTLEELKKIVSLPTVQSVRTGSRRKIRQNQ
jgi:hypothetical protein